MKRTLSLLLAVLMLLGVLAGCAGEPTSSTGTPDEPPAADPATPDEEPAGEPADTPAEDTGPVWPKLTEEDVTLTIMLSLGREISGMTNTPMHEENITWNEASRRTGVKLEFNALPDLSYNEQVSLAIASESLDDITSVGGNYAGGMDQAYDDGLFLCLDDYADLLPNYMYWVNLSDANRKAARSNEGHLMAMSQVYDRLESGWFGYCVRRDWLDALELEMPETIEEWDTVLRAFKENYTGAAGPLDMVSSAMPMSNFFIGAYGVASGMGTTAGIINVDGTLQYTYVSDGLRDYAELMRDWYEDGLLDSDFVSNTKYMFEAHHERLGRDEVGAASIITSATGSFYADTGLAVEGAYFELAPYPSLVKGELPKIMFKGADSALLGATGWMFSAESTHPELAIQFMDYFYSEEGKILSNYGVEGDTFYYDETGKPQFTEKMMNHPSLNFTGCMHWYLINNGVIMSVDRNEATMSDEALRYNEVWGTPGEYNFSAAVAFTPDETTEIGSIVSDLNVKVQESVVQWITGAEELNDDTWNEYLDQMDQIGWARFLEIVQDAYGRWLEK